MSRRKTHPLDLVRLEDRTTPTGFHMLADYHPGAGDSNPYPITAYGDGVVTVRYDGNAANLDAVGPNGATRLLSNIDQNPNAAGYAELGGKLYFPARAPGQGYQLFATNQNAPAVQITATNAQSSWGLFPQEMTLFQDALYFFGQDGAGTALYKFDGSQTFVVSHFNQGFDSGPSWHFNPHGLKVAGGKLYFAAADNDAGNPVSGHGYEPWVSDGTPGGTRMLADLNTSADASGTPGDSRPDGFVALGGKVYFAAANTAGERRLYSADAATGAVAEVTSIIFPADLSPAELTVFKDSLYFAANSESGGRELWATADGNSFVRFDLNPGAGDSNPAGLTVAGNHLFFRADDGAGHGVQLFATAGNAVPAVIPINASGSPFATSAGDDLSPYVTFSVVGSRVVFPANDGATGLEPWISDGTAGGTSRMADVNPGGDAFSIYSVTTQRAATAGGTTYLAMNDGSHGVELWAGDPPPPPVLDYHVTTFLDVDANPVAVNQPVRITATFFCPAGAPSGSVSFFANNSLIGTPRVPIVNGSASITESFSVENPYSLTAQFYPDDPFVAGPAVPAGSVSLIVGAGVQTSTAITGVSPTTVKTGEQATVNVRVTPASGTLPGGTVTVFVGNTQLGNPVPVDATGQVQVSGTVTAPAGTYPVVALYSGSGNYAGSRALDGPDLTVQTPKAPTTVTLAGPAEADFTEHLDLTAQVLVNGQPPSASDPVFGQVTLFVNGTRLVSLPADTIQGKARFSLPVQDLGLTPGTTAAFTARFEGDEGHEASPESAPLDVRITTHAVYTFLTTLDPVAGSVPAGTPLPVVARVQYIGFAAEAVTDQVIFAIDGRTASTVAAVHGLASARLDTAGLSVGPHQVTALVIPGQDIPPIFRIGGQVVVTASPPMSFTVSPPLPRLHDTVLVSGPRVDNGQTVGNFFYTLNPDGTFDGGSQLQVERQIDPAPVMRGVLADVTGDGTLDTILATDQGFDTRFLVLDPTRPDPQFLEPTDPFGGNTKLGAFVAAGDFDGDGRAEVVLTPDSGGGPRVVVYRNSGAGGMQQAASFFGIDDPNFRGGCRVAVADVNHDGTPDVIVAAGFGGGPRVAIFNGNTILSGNPEKLVNDFFAFPGEDATRLRNGAFVAAGDVDGDGYADLVFGGGPGGAPRVFTLRGNLIASGEFDAAYAAPLANFFVGGNLDDRGGVHLAARDLDGDGKAEILTGSGQGSTPARARIYSGKDVNGGEPANFQDILVPGELPYDGVYVG